MWLSVTSTAATCSTSMLMISPSVNLVRVLSTTPVASITTECIAPTATTTVLTLKRTPSCWLLSGYPTPSTSTLNGLTSLLVFTSGVLVPSILATAVKKSKAKSPGQNLLQLLLKRVTAIKSLTSKTVKFLLAGPTTPPILGPWSTMLTRVTTALTASRVVTAA